MTTHPHHEYQFELVYTNSIESPTKYVVGAQGKNLFPIYHRGMEDPFFGNLKEIIDNLFGIAKDVVSEIDDPSDWIVSAWCDETKRRLADVKISRKNGVE